MTRQEYTIEKDNVSPGQVARRTSQSQARAPLHLDLQIKLKHYVLKPSLVPILPDTHTHTHTHTHIHTHRHTDTHTLLQMIKNWVGPETKLLKHSCSVYTEIETTESSVPANREGRCTLRPRNRIPGPSSRAAMSVLRGERR